NEEREIGELIDGKTLYNELEVVEAMKLDITLLHQQQKEPKMSLKCALIPMLLDRYSKLFPDKFFTYEVRKRLLNFILAAFHQSLKFVAILTVCEKTVVTFTEAHSRQDLEMLMTIQKRPSWLCNYVGPLGNMEGAVRLTKMQLVNSLRV
nr:AP-5 complex subunit zeta-1 [Tanacetum cinerariifolium]